MLPAVCLAFQLLGFALSWWMGRKRYFLSVSDPSFSSKLKWMAPAALLAVDQLKFMERFPELTIRIHQKWISIQGTKHSLHHTKMYIADLCSACFLCIVAFTGFGILADGELILVAYGLVGAIFTPILMLRQLDYKIKKRKRQIILDLPEMLNKIILLVNAGETVQKAIVRCIEKQDNPKKTSLQVEFAQAAHELEVNTSFPKVMEGLSKRCAMQEVTLFTTTVLLNYKRGGDDFLLALKALSKDLWERRKTVSRALGEEASSKLVFPMVLIFLVVMVIVAAPAIMMMNH